MSGIALEINRKCSELIIYVESNGKILYNFAVGLYKFLNI